MKKQNIKIGDLIEWSFCDIPEFLAIITRTDKERLYYYKICILHDPYDTHKNRRYGQDVRDARIKKIA